MSYLENTFKWEWVLHEDLIKASSLSGEDMNILSKIKEDFQKEMSKASGDTTQYKSEISVSTTDISLPHSIIAVVFAFDAHKEGFFAGANPKLAFAGAVASLRDQCKQLGGDAVIGCQFEYPVAVGSGFFGGSKQVMEIFAYGTVVKFA